MSEEHKDSILSAQATDEHLHQNAKEDPNQDQRFDGLKTIHVWAYGVGHFINDLVAACWFNYLLYFLTKVVHTDAAPTALLSGQFADGVATPAVGLLSDKFNTRIGQRKPWYIIGLVLVVICYVPMWSSFKSQNLAAQYAFYAIFASIFNIGWASLQISHMSLVPSLTCSRKRRDKLNNFRNLFTFISNFVVLGFGLIIFSIMHDKQLEYKIIVYTVMGIGFCASIFFIKVIDEPTLVGICHNKQEDLKKIVEDQRAFDKKVVEGISEVSLGEQEQGALVPLVQKESIWMWFKMPKFYLFGVCYMSVRIYTNLFGTILPFYLTDVLDMTSKDQDQVSYSIALVPVLIYAASVATSTQLNKFYKLFGRKKALFFGTAICLACLAVMVFLQPEVAWIMYILAFFIGASQSLVLSTGINLISDVVGNKGKSGAFVFGFYSLLDKFSCGIGIFFIGAAQSFKREQNQITDDDRQFIRLTMVLISGLSCLLSSLIVLSYPIEEYSKDGKKKKNELLGPQKSSLEEELVS